MAAVSPRRIVESIKSTGVWTQKKRVDNKIHRGNEMFKKITTAITISALAALSLVSIAGAATGYDNFTIANGDPNEEGVTAQVKVQPLAIIGQPTQPLNIGAGDDSDMPSAPQGDYSNFTIANGDENEEGSVPRAKVQAVVTSDDSTPAGSGQAAVLNIGASDPAEQ
ncbi:MAG: hypothetical protein O3B95_02335 [Chloroflexi bacterium]|nr:hypothetical protein [Chloroflexota bacterium]